MSACNYPHCNADSLGNYCNTWCDPYGRKSASSEIEAQSKPGVQEIVSMLRGEPAAEDKEPAGRWDNYLLAADEIDSLLGKAVIKNTGLEAGFFAGVSVDHIADIIRKHCAPSARGSTKMVPLEPTEAMIEAGVKDSDPYISYTDAQSIYKAMLAAAPAEAARGSTIPVPREFVLFLLGEGEYRNATFGDRNPLYWWRTDLRAMLAAAPAEADRGTPAEAQGDAQSDAGERLAAFQRRNASPPEVTEKMHADFQAEMAKVPKESDIRTMPPEFAPPAKERFRK